MSNVTDLYDLPDEYVIYNDNDDILHPVKVCLPKLEEWYSKWLGREVSYEEAVKMVDGYGKAPRNQKFTYQQMPEKLRTIESVVRKKLSLKPKEVVRLEDINKELLDNSKKYEKEIIWIKKQIRRSYLGYWFFCNGKPTYITGQHYHYINFWPIGNNTRRDGLAEYRDRDRRWYVFVDYCRRTTEGWFKYKVIYLDENNERKVVYCNTAKKLKDIVEARNGAIYEEAEGGYLVDTGSRTCYGIIYPKHRREGATSRAGHGLWYGAAFAGIERKAGIQSITGDFHAMPVFRDHVQKRIRRMPFFFQLITTGAATESIQFTHPLSRAANAVVGEDSVLPHDGWINYKSAQERAYDGEKMHVMLHDEIGKMGSETGVNVYTRYEVVRKCLAQGPNIHGFIYCTSTLGEMMKGGGEQMRKMIMDSLFRNRDDNGFTISGLLTLFFPAFDGFDGYIDEYGMSIIDDPKSGVYNSNGDLRTTGSRTFLENTRMGKLLTGDESGYVSFVQDFPFTLMECFMSTAKGSAFPIKRIRDRITELLFKKELTNTYRLEWVGEKFGKVRAVPDPEGKHIFSFMPINSMMNQWVIDERGQQGVIPHLNRKFIVGVDPARFSSEEVDGKKKSYHAAVTYMCYDPAIDPEDKPREEWLTDRWIHTFKDRDMSIDMQDEEMAKLCILLGAMMYVENNEPHTYRFFQRNNLDGYLIYDVNPETGEKALKPGRTATDGTQNSSKQELFLAMEEKLKIDVEREVHLEVLEQCQEIVELKDMTKFDLFAAAGWSIVGSRSNYFKFVENIQNDDNFLDSLPIPTYDI
jgi:hypothetical protein